ncbi:MAG: hypothetical protein DIU76_02035 [Bacillota bacterium]|nr:MAG: hypothetical protein DIU76_02035 [Bacillota bacterium]
MDQVTHLRHLLDERGQPAPGRPGALARYYGAIVAAASAQRPGEEVLTPLRCRRRPDRRPCHGHLWVRCTGPEDREEVRWRCPVCGDGGVIRGWQGTAFDRRQDRLPPDAPQVGVLTFASAFQVREFRRLPGLSPEALRILDRARQTTAGVVVEVTADELRRLRSEFEALRAVARGRNALILAALLAQMDHQLGSIAGSAAEEARRRRGDQVGDDSGHPPGRNDQEEGPPRGLWMAMERELRKLDRLLQGREFASAEELNAFVQGYLEQGGLPELPAESALELAQELAYTAWEADDPAERVRLAREALSLSADCADAWVILGHEADSLEEAIRCYTEGVRAGERALGARVFEEDSGHFWGLVTTRPYMRARFALAQALYQAGRTDEAIAHGRELLRLNPNDNQGVRYLLVHWLLETKRSDEAEALLREYDEDSAFWLYARALCTYQRGGDTWAARRAAGEAFAANPHVVPLLAEDLADLDEPESFTPGGREEALIYWNMALGAWQATEDALAWLVGVFRQWIRPEPARRKKVGRNDPCPCGSGRKYKHCCLRRGDGRQGGPGGTTSP